VENLAEGCLAAKLFAVSTIVPVASSGIYDPRVEAKTRFGVINVEVERTARLAGGCYGALDCFRIGWADYAVFVQTYDNGSYHLAPFGWVYVLCDMAFSFGVVFLQFAKLLPELFRHIHAASMSPSVRRIDSPQVIAVQVSLYELVVLGHLEPPSLVKQGDGSICFESITDDSTLAAEIVGHFHEFHQFERTLVRDILGHYEAVHGVYHSSKLRVIVGFPVCSRKMEFQLANCKK
jgi:hypothetical protein